MTDSGSEGLGLESQRDHENSFSVITRGRVGKTNVVRIPMESMMKNLKGFKEIKAIFSLKPFKFFRLQASKCLFCYLPATMRV